MHTSVGENANLNYVIMDKEVVVRDNSTLTSVKDFPVVVGKKKTV